MTPAQLQRATGSTAADAEKYCMVLDQAMERFLIESPKQRAAFIGTVDVESQSLSKVEEGFYYSDAERLARTFKRLFNSDPAKAAPYTRNPKALSVLLYPDRMWGRGLIQLTWASNYMKCGQALGFNYLAEPDLLLQPWHAAMSAGWFWSHNGCNLPALSGNMEEVTRRVNGPAMLHLSERKASYRAALAEGV